MNALLASPAIVAAVATAIPLLVAGLVTAMKRAPPSHACTTS